VTTVAAGAAQRPLASGYPPPRLLRSRHTKRRALTLAATSAGLLVVNPETEVRDLRAVVNDLRRVAEYRLSADKQQAGLRSSRALGS
jgi:hypothetical protein